LEMLQDSGIIRLMQFSLIFINETYIESLISLLGCIPYEFMPMEQ